jgi:hypothetical protein
MKMTIYLKPQESEALKNLAQKEYRLPNAQALLIIRKELERLGFLLPKDNGTQKLEIKNDP